ncbi:glutamate receptor 2.5-like [Ziziphus jujuba]|uniref:Glutamate receptor n=1 Tax=Ziziphus jujuba TaxID=326968 RepID=A0A6P3ZHC2_ZIZJJ|nr:glutamate receptor 2.5-like [Ziziphus jujuba]
MDIHRTLVIIFFGIVLSVNAVDYGSMESKQVVRVGVILDSASPLGKMANSCISMALSDFYSINANYRTRLALSVKDSVKDVVKAASAALELMNKEQVQAIIGPQTSTEADFVIDLGDRAQIPIISFSATSPSLSPTHNPFFIRTAQDDSSKVTALTSIVEAYGWKKVVLICEDSEYGTGLIPYFTDAFQEINVRVSYRSIISPNSNQFEILKQLNMIMARQTRILLVHVSALLGSKLFSLAKQIGMMSEGYAWITTKGLSISLLDPMGEKVIDSMHGVVDVRPYLPNSKRLQDFKTRWHKINSGRNIDLDMFGLWAYDTVWALAMAAELVDQQLNPNALSHNISTNITSTSTSTELFDLEVSEWGPELLQMLLRANIEGLSGEFRLMGGQLQARDFEIINLRRKLGERVIGHWTHLNQSLEIDRKAIIWPGHTKVPPKGWVNPVFGKRLRIGVPVASSGFKEFLDIEWDPHTGEPSFSGFTYDIFVAALDKLPFALPHKLIPYVNRSKQSNGTYDDLLCQIKLKKLDAVIGGITIVANRTKYVDFTLPYKQSGVSMVVKVKKDEMDNMWVILKPLGWDLWLAIGVAFVFTGIAVWFLEHHTNEKEEFKSPPGQKLPGTILWFSISILVFANSEKLENKWSRFVLVIWVFMVLILTQSYTASLTSMLTVPKYRPAVADINELRRNDYFVGFQKNSYVNNLLTEQLKYPESRLRSYTSLEEYDDAMSKGSKNGGIDAIFDEIPFVQLFLAKYGSSKYKVVGPTYKSAGFGYAFPIGSPLVSYISKAILNVTQDPNKMEVLEIKYFEQGTKCEDSFSADDDPSLSVYNFSGLFIIIAIASIFAYLTHLIKPHCSWSATNAIHPDSSLSLWSRVTKREKPCHMDHNNLHAKAEVSVNTNEGDHLQNPPTAFSQEIVDINQVDEEDEIHNIDSGLYIYGCA